MRRHRGVTLVELLMAVAVLAIVLAMAAPWLADLINQRRTLAVAEALVSDLAYARSEAGLRLQQVMVDFRADAETSCYTLHYAYEGSNCNCLRGQGQACQTLTGRALPDIELRTVSVPGSQGVSVKVVPGSWPAGATEYRLAFIAPQMTADPEAARIHITGRPGPRLQVQLNAVGRTLLCSREEPAHGLPACR